jgi:hypothetical protein
MKPRIIALNIHEAVTKVSPNKHWLDKKDNVKNLFENAFNGKKSFFITGPRLYNQKDYFVEMHEVRNFQKWMASEGIKTEVFSRTQRSCTQNKVGMELCKNFKKNSNGELDCKQCEDMNKIVILVSIEEPEF